MKKYLISGGTILAALFITFSASAGTTFWRFSGSPTVYNQSGYAYHSQEEFLKAGGSWDKVQTVGQFGSVQQGGEYTASSTRTDIKSGFYTLISANMGTLGSVIIASSSGATIELWNATSTTDVASTSIVKFKASVAEGTYTFDLNFDRGLILRVPAGSSGDFVTTYRQR